ncbi:MAG: ABC transport system protein [Acetothermia bacterium 64_32]|nr:MAG: ABC transport system protein [Acetothermia bacterium 64_32]MBC7098590.1 ABC transporter ATP-binding protein [Candidatus Bipolaricaulota bacterium]HAF69759.1 macrolide ABC transporter ATP-binding protein [Candidatus Acetothermia bacterium]
MSQPLLQLEGVTKVYRMGQVEVPALRGVDLTLDPGASLAIMGPSGSGKSTLLHIAGLLDRPTSGRVIWAGEDSSSLSPARLAELRGRHIGFVFQTFNLIPTLSALENVELPLLFQGERRGQRRRRAAELLSLVGLADRKGHRPGQLSGGERQRVAIARALASDPELLLADEPTGNLDSASGREILEVLRDLNRRGKALVLVTHDAEAAAVATRVLRMRDGRLLEGTG